MSVVISIFNIILLGSILYLSWNYGVTELSPSIPTIGLIDVILIKMAFTALIGTGFKFSASFN